MISTAKVENVVRLPQKPVPRASSVRGRPRLAPGPHVDPYEKCLMEALIEVRELLRHGRALPEHRFMATRPDGT